MHNLIIVGLAGNGKSSVGNIILHKNDVDIADSDIKECKCTLKKNETFSVVECQGMADGLEDLYSLWNKAENALKLLESHNSAVGTEAHSKSDDSDESKKEDMDVPDIQNQADGNEPNSKHQKNYQCKNEEHDTNTAERKEADLQDNPTNVDPKPGFDVDDSDINENKCIQKNNKTFSVLECQRIPDGLEDLPSFCHKPEKALKMLESHNSAVVTEAHSESDDNNESKKEDVDVPDNQNQADGNEPNSKHKKIDQCKNEENDANTAERKEANSQDNPTNADPKPGFDALIFVIKYGVRFTKQDTKSVKLIKDIFGEDIFKNRGIIVMTFGDNLDHTDFNTFLSKIQGDLKLLENEVNDRFVLMNKNANETDKKKQVQLLEQKILEIKHKKQQKYDINEFKENKLKNQNLFFKEQSLNLEQTCKTIIWKIKIALRNGTDINSFTEEVKRLHTDLNSFNENANEEMCKILNTHFVDYVTTVIIANKKDKEKSLFKALNSLKKTAKNKIKKNCIGQ